MKIDKEREALFEDWLIREMPPGTVIGDPKWWAPRILRAALGGTFINEGTKIREGGAALDEQNAGPSDEELLRFIASLDPRLSVPGMCRALLSKYAAPVPKEVFCSHCGGSGDAHSPDGGWRGSCNCSTGKAIAAPAPKGGPVAWLHQCRKKPGLKSLSFSKLEPKLKSLGYAATPLYAEPVNDQDEKDARSLVSSLVGASNYIDKLGGDSRAYRMAITAIAKQGKGE